MAIVNEIEMEGEYQKDSAPLIPLTYQFADSDGDPLDISAHNEVKFLIRDPDGIDSEHGAIFGDKSLGFTQVTWTTAMTNKVGKWRGIMWLYPGPQNGVRLVWRVTDGPGPTE